MLFGLSNKKAFGEETSIPTQAQTQKTIAPVDVERATLFHLLVYSQKGEILSSDFIDTVGNVKDEEITRLLQTAKSSANTGEWLGWIGAGAACSGLFLTTSNNTGTSNLGLGIFLGGISLHIAHDLFLDQADTALFNSVERYNQSYWGELDDSSTTKASRGLSPIHTHFSTLGGFEYLCAGKKLENDGDFNRLFVASNDFSVQRMFKDSQGSGTAGTILEAVGGAGCLGSAVGYFSTQNSGNKTGYAWIFVSSAVVALVGDWFMKDSESGKFNAVQRYNRFARGQEAVLPQVPDNEKDLLNFGSQATTEHKNP